MTKLDLIKATAEKANVSKKDAEAVFDAFASVVTETLSANKEEKVVLPNLGAFTVKHVAAKTGKIMMGEHKGESWTTPEKDELKFTIAKNVKEI